MASQTASQQETAVVKSKPGFLTGKRGRKIREALLAYALLLPAIIIILTFGLFPLVFSAYQSTLKGLNKIVGTFDGLGNYVKAIDNLAYVLGFWLSIIFIFLAIKGILLIRKTANEHKEGLWIWAIPALGTAVAIALFTRFFFILLPAVLGIPGKVPRGQSLTREMALQFFGEAWQTTNQIQSTFWVAMLAIGIAIVLVYLVTRYAAKTPRDTTYFAGFLQSFLFFIGAIFLTWLTWAEIQKAYAVALEKGVGLDIWVQIITISVGFILLILSYILWRNGSNQDSTLKLFLRLVASIILIIAAWVLIAELPRAIASGDKIWWRGLQVTVYFSIITIPLQFMISLTLATILFQNLRGTTWFRIFFFLPYIAPIVGTAAAFRIIFSGRANAPVNTILSSLGFETLRWLNEPTGIFKLMAGGANIPAWMAGPSLALITIIFYNVWTYIGFDMVIFLAGLGNISKELYEAASIDGSGRWSQFRHITIPLLSPTIYFLMLLAVIGTFKSFNRIYVMRQGAALGTTDPVTVVIFEAFNRDTRYGYASALAMMLLIIIVVLTVINNRVAEDRVFYG